MVVLSGNMNSKIKLDRPKCNQHCICLQYKNLPNIESSSLLKSKNDRIVSVGFSESENAEKIKVQVISQIKTLL